MVCAPLAFIEGLGGAEMLLIFVVILVLFGGDKLPGFARGLGKTIREFKKAASGVEEEFKRALDEDERKHATPALPAPAAETTPVPATVDDQGGPAAEHSGHDDGYSHSEEPYEDYTTKEPDHAQPTEPKILPPSSPAAETSATPVAATPAPPAEPTPAATTPSEPAKPATPPPAPTSGGPAVSS